MPLLAREIMTPSIKTVPQSWTMDRLARFLTDNEIAGSPVADDNGEIIGIVTLKDITEFRRKPCRPETEAQLTEDEAREARRLRMAIYKGMGKLPVEVRDIMTSNLLSVEEDTPVREIAKTMMAEHLHRIFVTLDGKITGIITTYDLLKIIVDRDMTRRYAMQD
ncbi:MAG: CBS domain-containing protein [Marinobacter sp.]